MAFSLSIPRLSGRENEGIEFLFSSRLLEKYIPAIWVTTRIAERLHPVRHDPEMILFPVSDSTG